MFVLLTGASSGFVLPQFSPFNVFRGTAIHTRMTVVVYYGLCDTYGLQRQKWKNHK
jgi:hypothetical protein